jgi:hypothetical protein
MRGRCVRHRSSRLAVRFVFSRADAVVVGAGAELDWVHRVLCTRQERVWIWLLRMVRLRGAERDYPPGRVQGGQGATHINFL